MFSTFNLHAPFKWPSPNQTIRVACFPFDFNGEVVEDVKIKEQMDRKSVDDNGFQAVVNRLRCELLEDLIPPPTKE